MHYVNVYVRACMRMYTYIYMCVWLTRGCKVHCRILQYNDHSLCESAHIQLL